MVEGPVRLVVRSLQVIGLVGSDVFCFFKHGLEKVWHDGPGTWAIGHTFPIITSSRPFTLKTKEVGFARGFDFSLVSKNETDVG